MNVDSRYFKDWKEADLNSLYQLTACTGDPGNLWPYPNSALPERIQTEMADLRDSYISGYLKPEAIQNGLSGIGELVVTREDCGQGKGYVWLVAVSPDGKAYYRGPFKPKEGHYFELDNAVPLGRLFGKI